MIHPVILSGGSGTRLWPMSRSAYPKQLLPLLSELSLLQETVKRTSDAANFSPPLLLANDAHRFIIAEQLRQIGIQPAAIMLEPEARNTAPAAAAASFWVSKQDGDGLILLLPSDHVIGNVPGFRAAVAQGTKAALAGKLITFGIKADRPETGYGYIRKGTAFTGNGAEGVFEVASFVEKPDKARAETYLASGEYTWNSGIFLFSASRYLKEYEIHDPEGFAAVKAAFDQAATDLDFVRLDGDAFAKATNQSIDYAVMEKTKDAAVVPVDMGWSDLGAWDALWATQQQTGDGNVELGDIVSVDCRNSYLRSEDGLVAALGLDEIIVVATTDAVMVAPKSRAQDLKKLVDRLKQQKRPELEHQAVVHRPWGTYESLHVGHRVQVKHITVKPGAQLSLQLHHHRAEHWVVVQGTAVVTRGEEEVLLSENQSTYIPLGVKHRLYNPGRIPLHLVEVQSGSYLGEDDIVRFQDNYGRA
jgi:mannose-1-phosphate guanylyltransferase/mannose-6-phosphate isomerase